MPDPQPQTTDITAVPGRTPMFEDSDSWKAVVQANPELKIPEAFDWHLTRTWWIFFEQLRRKVATITKIIGGGGSNRRCATFNLAVGGDAKTLVTDAEAITVWVSPENIGTIEGWDFIAAAPPTGSSMIIDIIDESGSSIFGPTKVVIPAGDGTQKIGGGFASEITISTPHSKRFRAYFTQVGSTTAGRDVSGNLWYKAATGAE